MRKLLHAELRRMFRSGAFWVPLLLILSAGALLPVVFYLAMHGYPEALSLDTYLRDYPMLAAMLLSVFAALFIGTEYSDGTIRNKLIAGHRRSAIYLSELFVTVLAGLLMQAAFLLPYLSVGLPLLGGYSEGAAAMLRLIGSAACITAVFAALYVLVAMLCRSKAHSAIVCLLLVLALVIGGVVLVSRLNEPEFYSSYTYYSDIGETVTEDIAPNPNYLSGTTRKVCMVLNDLLPGNQLIRIFTGDHFSALRFLIYDALILAAVSAVGLVVFRRKNLK